MERRVDPEILDSLPADDPEAVQSRRDLRWINALMGNHRWISRRIRALRRANWRILELGAGDGTLGRRLVTQCGVDPVALTAVDLAPQPEHWPAAAQWRQQDLFGAPLPEAEIVVANLFLHHFEKEELQRLGRLLPASCRVLLCSEPARRPLHLYQGKILSLLPLSSVTRHDMPVSIRAGFLREELPAFLGLEDWQSAVSTTFFGAYRLEATRA